MNSTTDRILDRFFSKVEVRGEHEIWTGARDTNNYGVFFLSKRRKLRTIRAHVFAYEFYYGVEAVLDVHHTCSIRNCVKKEHLKELSSREHGRLHGQNNNHNKKTHMRSYC